MQRRTGTLLAIVVMAAPLLGACSGSDGGDAAPSPSTSPGVPVTAPSATTTTTAPDVTIPPPTDDFASSRDPFAPQG
jgi:hypothetical protein